MADQLICVWLKRHMADQFSTFLTIFKRYTFKPNVYTIVHILCDVNIVCENEEH